MIKEEIIRVWSGTELGRAQFKKRLILVGAAEDTARLLKELNEKSSDSIEVLAHLNLNNTPVERLADLLHEHSANGVILSAAKTYFGQIERAIEVCELEGVEVWLLADFFKTQISRTTFDEFHGHPTLVFRSAPEASWQGLMKHLIDFVGALVLLLGTLIITVPAAVLIRLTSPGPVLFRQKRSGLNGKPFTMLKFRSMVTDAEQRKQELAAFNEVAGPAFKLTADPRITPLGRWLRRFSIDELPQLWNVLRGEMSLVGPRPLPVDEVTRFDDLAHRRRLSVKPGLTCLWQIRGRSNLTDFKEWVRLDLEYIDNWSLWLDLKILLRTIPVVILGTGAK
jgi:exopolysaccharide biosynthesis polyprenyl glycosylphosphotransferase